VKRDLHNEKRPTMGKVIDSYGKRATFLKRDLSIGGNAM